jgi:protein phosphatase
VQAAFAAQSDIGRKRAANEDFYAVDEGLSLFVVADGLGGHVAGRVASETAVHEFVSHVRRDERSGPLTRVRDAMRTANRAILAKVSEVPYLQGMGTTLAAVWLQRGRAVFAHVGDSRIYLLRDRRLSLLTMDHSYVCELVFRRRLSADAARTHPNRHVILRALGVDPPCEPDVGELRLEPQDVLVLCTDGLTGAVADEELAEMLDKGRSDLSRTASALIDCANARGGYDNVTVVLLRMT